MLFAEGTEEWADRLKLLVQLNVVVLAQDLWCNEHYFWMMRPWVHYVPVGTRFEHLGSAVAWLRENDSAAQAIAANASAFAKEHLSRDALLSFHRTLLAGYAALLGDGRVASRLARPATEVLPARLDEHAAARAHRVQRGNVTLCHRAPRL